MRSQKRQRFTPKAIDRRNARAVGLRRAERGHIIDTTASDKFAESAR
jgi:hypothetical protein